MGIFGVLFVTFWVPRSVSSGFHPQANGQSERANQQMEMVLSCRASHDPASWTMQLPWVKYSMNSQPSSSMGLSPFQCCLGYQPPVFPAQEEDVGVPSAQAFISCCRRTWRRARSALLRSHARTKCQADCCRYRAPHYTQGQRVWLSSRDIPLKVAAPKVSLRFIGPFTIAKVISRSAVRLKLNILCHLLSAPEGFHRGAGGLLSASSCPFVCTPVSHCVWGVQVF